MINQYGYYQPQYQNQYQNQYQQPQDERIWVQSEQAAENYLVAPNGFVRLWDSTKPIFYERRADATGRPLPMDVYEYQRKSAAGQIDISQELNEIKDRIAALENKKGVKSNAKSNADDTAVQSV